MRNFRSYFLAVYNSVAKATEKQNAPNKGREKVLKMITEQEEYKRGLEIIRVLGLKHDKKTDRVATTHGSKTPLGLFRTMQKLADATDPNEIEFTRVNSDINGNPRHVCHFLCLADTYSEAVKLANTLGGRKFNTKQYGGGLVFSSYNLEGLKKRMQEIRTNKK